MFESIKSKLIIRYTSLIILALIALSVIFSIILVKDLSNSYEQNAKDLLEATSSHLVTQHQSIIFHKEHTLKDRKAALKTYVDLTLTVIQVYYDEYKKGLISESQAKKRVISKIEQIRYQNNIGYYWINDTGRPFPKMVMHPTLPELNGDILDDPVFNCALGIEENLFKAFVDVTEKSGEGYVDYKWPKPTKEGLTEIQPKISYVKLFKPWNWIIGTGLYIDDIEKEADNRLKSVINELNDTIPKLKVGENGYFYIFNENSDVLVHPNLRGENIKHLRNPATGNYLTVELKDTVNNKNSSLTYLWDKPGFEKQYRFKKTAYVAYYEPLGWYIASSVYRDDLLNKVYETIDLILFIVLLASIIVVTISITISKSLTKPLYKLMEPIKKRDDNGLPNVLVPSVKTKEFNELGQTINNMITSLSIYHNKLSSIFDYSFKTIIIATDKDGLITIFNAGAENILGYSSSDMVGKETPLKLYLKEEILEISKELKDVQNDFDILSYNSRINGYEEREWTFIKKGGDQILVSQILTPLFDRNNKIDGYVGFATDISKTKKQELEIIDNNIELSKLNDQLNSHKENLELLVKNRTHELELSLERLKKTQDKLIQSEKMASLGGLVAGVAHEINTPVGIGVTAASHLEHSSEDFAKLYRDGNISRTAFEKYIKLCIESSKLILSNMKRASDLIQSFKQVAVDQSTEVKRDIKLKDFIAELLLSIHSKYKRSSHKIEINIKDDIVIHNNPGALYQVITNLINNSMIHGFESLENRKIIISITKCNETLIIEHKDNGVGIESENIKKIFEPFYTTKRGQGGSGLGLNIVYNTVKSSLKGSIECISEINKFTKFIIKIPCNIED